MDLPPKATTKVLPRKALT